VNFAVTRRPVWGDRVSRNTAPNLGFPVLTGFFGPPEFSGWMSQARHQEIVSQDWKQPRAMASQQKQAEFTTHTGSAQ